MHTTGSRFSPIRNLRHLLVRPESDLAPLDGLRSIAVLWVLFFHLAYFLGGWLGAKQFSQLLESPALALLWRGDFGVDVFFVLSGFLIASSLFDEKDRTGSVSIRRFYARRAMRLLPAYYLALAWYALLKLPNVDNVWANLLYVNNFLPVLRQCMAWSWSLAIEEQFYVVFPLFLVGFFLAPRRARPWVLVALFVLELALCTNVVVRNGLVLADVDVAPKLGNDARWARAMNLYYQQPHLRFGALLCGVIAAYLRRYDDAIAFLEKRVLVSFLGAGIAAVTIVWALRLLGGDPTSRFSEVVYLASYRHLFAASVAFLMMLSLSRHPLGRVLGAVLGHRVTHPIAQLAYGIYLLNPLSTMALYRLHPIAWSATMNELLLYGLVYALASIGCAAVMYLLIERPIMNLRPR